MRYLYLLAVHNWEAQVQFKVSGKGKDLFGDGFMIWYTKDRMEGGPVFGSKDFFTGLAISVDTYSNQNGPHNHQHPYISAMLNNGSKKYDHDKDGTHLQLAGCETKIRNLKHDTFIAINYENDVLKVFTDVEGKNGWKPCLEVPGVKLPTGYYFGVSAVTGELSDNHDLISFKLYSKDMPGQEFEDRSDLLPTAEFFEAPRDYEDELNSLDNIASEMKRFWRIREFSVLK
nr:EOG090X07L3 [Artemia franciscana]